MAMKEQVKESAGLGNLERQVKKKPNIFDSPKNSPRNRSSVVNREEQRKLDEQKKKEQKLKQQYLKH